MTITALNGALPPDTVVKVGYGGGTEEYDLASPPAQPEVVFCKQVGADSGTGAGDAGGAEAGSTDAGSAPVMALVCDLWTNAAATIDVEGSGYPLLEQQLQAQKDDCGIKTVEYALVLGETDAGS